MKETALFKGKVVSWGSSLLNIVLPVEFGARLGRQMVASEESGPLGWHRVGMPARSHLPSDAT